jgi:hypothetical protein
MNIATIGVLLRNALTVVTGSIIRSCAFATDFGRPSNRSVSRRPLENVLSAT